MAVYAISDLHLPAGNDKPMDIFGEHWENHFDRIRADWLEKVEEEDIVLLPGDLSWGMQLSDALQDLNAIGALPGKKIITRGNHDYWWSSIGRVRDKLPKNMYALQNDSLLLDGYLFSGTRGWILPAEEVDEGDVRIFRRELGRLRMSLDHARRLSKDADIICMLHYPPLTDAVRETEVTQILKEYAVRHVVYGHLHASALCGAFRGVEDGIHYHQVSCDGLDFKLHKVTE